MASAEREPITGAWRRSPQRGPEKPLVRESWGRSAPKAENLLASGCATKAANLPNSPQFADSLNPHTNRLLDSGSLERLD